MRLVVHIVRVIVESLQYAIATRRISVAVAILVGLALVALALSAQVAAPLAVYPFA